MSEENTRIVRLEEDVRELRDTNKEVFNLLREVRESQIRSEERATRHSCPNPGACIHLAQDLERLATDTEKTLKHMETTLGEHEKSIQRATGAANFTKWAIGILGLAGIGAFLRYLISK